MKYSCDFSIIIPHRNSVHFLPKLFSSIPESDKIEVILVDNSPEPITMEQVREVGVTRDFTLLFSAPSRGAGGARNEGIEHASGKWLLFLDADDFFSEGAFDAFNRHVNSDAEIIYFCMGGIYEDTGERSNRGDNYTNLVMDYRAVKIDEMKLRLNYSSPCAKMVSHALVDRHNIRYDEVLASNDTYFSMLTGYYATKVDSDPTEVYIATVSRGSLTRRRDFAVVLSRYQVALRFNKFLKEHGLSDRQKSVMVYFYNARPYGFKALLRMFWLAIKFRQNLFIGANRWSSSLSKKQAIDKKEEKYIAK
ncbi:MAG: glycosyltransferase family 2 protein [Bacteroidales bacterium]|nr:glycosyltransferase family 2 protein [Bacteroidales bacterium]